MRVKTVVTIGDFDSAGNLVDVLPTRIYTPGDTDSAGQPVTPVVVEEDPKGTPVRVVAGKTAFDAAGNLVEVLATTGGGPGPEPELDQLTFPAKGALYDIDFTTESVFGGTQSFTGNTSGNFFIQAISSLANTFVEQANRSLKAITQATRLRTSNKGLFIEHTSGWNPITQNRNLADASWTKTNCTVVRNVLSRDGNASGASRITATAANATVLKSGTTSSTNAHYLRSHVKRISGTGLVEMTIDGTTWLPVPFDNPVYDGWCVVNMGQKTGDAYNIGFRLAVSGDVIAVDFVGNNTATDREFGPIQITTTAGTRGRDRPSAQIAQSSPLATYARDAAFQCVFFEWSQRQAGSLAVSDGGFTINAHLTGFNAWGTVTTTEVPIFASSARLDEINRGMAWRTPTETGVCLNGGPIVRGAGQAPNGALTHWDLGTNGAGSARIDGRISRVICFDQMPTDAESQLWTSPT